MTNLEPTTIDLETTTWNKGNAFDTRNFIVSAHIKYGNGPTTAVFYDDPSFLTKIKKATESIFIVGHNLKFDLSWLQKVGRILQPRTRVWDTMVAEFVLSGQTTSFASLNTVSSLYSLGCKEDLVSQYWEKGVSTENIPREIVESYGNHDVDLTYAVYLKQLEDPRMTPALHRLILLEGADLQVLQRIEYNGLKFDVQGAETAATALKAELQEILNTLHSFTEHPINFNSPDQLSCFMYGGSYSEDITIPETTTIKSGPNKGQERTINRYAETKTYNFPGYFTPLPKTELAKGGIYSTAAEVLLQLKAKTKQQRTIIACLQRMAIIEKLVGTYLDKLPQQIKEMNWADNIIHGQYNQVVARTGRLSSSKPNAQNIAEEANRYFISRYN